MKRLLVEVLVVGLMALVVVLGCDLRPDVEIRGRFEQRSNGSVGIKDSSFTFSIKTDNELLMEKVGEFFINTGKATQITPENAAAVSGVNNTRANTNTSVVENRSSVKTVIVSDRGQRAINIRKLGLPKTEKSKTGLRPKKLKSGLQRSNFGNKK